MIVAIPEFVLRKLVVPGSLRSQADGFALALRNTFAPGTITQLALAVDGRTVPPEALTLQTEGEPPRPATTITEEKPFPLPVGTTVAVQVRGVPIGQGRLRIQADTREVGPLVIGVQMGARAPQATRSWTLRWPRWLRRRLKAEVEVDAGAVIGEIHPHVYGHFVEHLERCVYGGIWSEDGSRLREDTLEWIAALRPPVIRYPGGNFASGYHWEDGIGPHESRPSRYDEAWKSEESNQVGTDEFMAFCARVGAEPILVVNDGSGTPEEAARWVAYCHGPPESQAGRRRAANGHPEPYGVRLWGVGNEVWGQWQIGHTDACGYAQRLRQFVSAMRQADPSIRIVAVGQGVLTEAADDPGKQWNEVVLREAGDLIDYLSFHIYQPGQEGWLESYDPEQLHHTVCAAPLDVERAIQRMARQIAEVVPGRDIKVALDEWNLWLAPPPEAETMHRVVYTGRDALYVAGMLNAFQRCCNELALANLAQLVNVLPAIVTDGTRAYATPIYYPFLMYHRMERLALRARVQSPTFSSQALGNIQAQRGVPYLDVTATRDEAGERVVLGIVNRHPTLACEATVHLRGFGALRLTGAWILSAPNPLATNSFDAPQQVVPREVRLPGAGEEEVGMSLCLGAAGELSVHEAVPPTAAEHGDRQVFRFPAASVTVIELKG